MTQQNNTPTPNAQDILDAIRNKSANQNAFNSGATIGKMFKRVQQNGPITVAFPNGKSATFSEREVDPLTDERSLENPISVRTALEIAFEKYEETDDNGPEIHEAIVTGEPVTVSDKNKDLADKCLLYFGHYLFDKKLNDPASLSDWENEVAKLVSTPDRFLKRMWTSLVTTLPRFYSINITKLKLMELKESIPDGISIEFDTTVKSGDKEIPLVSKLKFIETFVERNSKKNHQTYIFSTNYNNSYLVQYVINRDDFDKVRMLDYILANNAKNGVFECRLLAQSKYFAHNFNCLDVQAIEFL